MNPIVSIYKLMGINVSMNLSNADEENSQSIRDRQSTMDRQSIMDSLNLLSSKIIVLEEDKIRSDGKILELDSKIIVLEEDKIRLNDKVSLLEKECLHSKLENNA